MRPQPYSQHLWNFPQSSSDEQSRRHPGLVNVFTGQLPDGECRFSCDTFGLSGVRCSSRGAGVGSRSARVEPVCASVVAQKVVTPLKQHGLRFGHSMLIRHCGKWDDEDRVGSRMGTSGHLVDGRRSICVTKETLFQRRLATTYPVPHNSIPFLAFQIDGRRIRQGMPAHGAHYS